MSPNSHEADAVHGKGEERLKQEVWARNLTPIPTTLRRLIYLASLRNDNTERYENSELTQLCSEAGADVILREVHEDVFRIWLNFSLQEQQQELKEYLDALAEQKVSGGDTWLTLAPYKTLIPAQAEAAERELFCSDVEMLLERLKSKLP